MNRPDDNKQTEFSLRRQLRASLLIGAMVPASAFAFIDERTPAPPPVPVATPIEVPLAPVQPIAPVQGYQPIGGVQPIGAVQPVQAIAPIVGAAASSTPVAVQLEHGVKGDITHPAWQQPYPGPYGQMPLADALIAQVVPVVGRAIELNGPPELLNKRVTLIKGANRIETLKNMAVVERLGVMIQGELVSLASSSTPSRAPMDVDAFQAQGPAEVVKVTKTWNIQPGTMLSTAMLDWAKEWGWKLIWKADVDYRIAAAIQTNGDFLDTVGEVLEAYKLGDRPLWGDWNDSQKVLVIREPTNRDR